MSADRIGAFLFDAGKADRGMRRPGIFTSDLGDVEKVKRMRKRAEIEAMPDTPARAAQKARRRTQEGDRNAPPLPAVAHPVAPSKAFGTTPNASRPSKLFSTTENIPGPSMLDQLAKVKAAELAAKAAHASDPEPEPTLSMTELLRLARAKAGKS
jgi:hypothetical protein